MSEYNWGKVWLGFLVALFWAWFFCVLLYGCARPILER